MGDYVAPEVLTWYDDDDNGTPYGKGSDLWSLGVLLYVILSGCSPFCAEEEEQLLKQVAEAKYEFFENEWKGISDEAKDLVRRLLVVDPLQRLKMDDMLEHPWLKDSVSKCRQEVLAKHKASQSHRLAATTSASCTGASPGDSPAATKDQAATTCGKCILL